MSIQPSTHEQLQKEFKDILQPFKAESLSGRCADIVIRERMKVLTLKSHSDQPTGEWRNTNPHEPGAEL